MVKSEAVVTQDGISGSISSVACVPPPILTLGEPSITVASQVVLSPTREAGNPLIYTEPEPSAI